MPTFQLPAELRSGDARSRAGRLLLRTTLAGIIGAHGWARLMAGGVPPFGAFLETQGFPGGLYWAALVTGIEIVASLLLLFGRWVVPVAMVLSAIYALGIALVHAAAGWFVVGLGRNGSEFSVLLIACLLSLALQQGRPSNDAAGKRGRSVEPPSA